MKKIGIGTAVAAAVGAAIFAIVKIKERYND